MNYGFTIISDIDDVIRNFRKNIVSAMNLYYHTDDWGEYHFNNPKIREFFDWYREQPYFFHLYENSSPNTDIINMYNKLMYRNSNVNLFFLSSNKYKMGQVLTNNFIFEHFTEQYISSNIFYVDRWFNKIDHVRNNSNIYGLDKENTVFIDDRPDTCLSFIKDGRKAFWYTKYQTPNAKEMWLKDCPEAKDIPCGNTTDFEQYLKKTIGGINV